MRRHGKGIFGNDTKKYTSHKTGEVVDIPKAPIQVRVRLAEKAAEFERRERAKWAWTILLAVLLPLVLYLFGEAIWDALSWLLWDDPPPF